LPHSSYGGRIIGFDRIRAEQDLVMEDILDPFGNRLTRLKAPVGALTLWSNCTPRRQKRAPGRSHARTRPPS